jgi:hypothetical protein
MIEKIATGCIDCPFNYRYDMAIGYGCEIDSSNRTIKQSKKYQPINPRWCQLKSDGVLVRLNKTQKSHKTIK